MTWPKRWSQRRLALPVPLSRLTSLARRGSAWVLRYRNYYESKDIPEFSLSKLPRVSSRAGRGRRRQLQLRAEG